MSDFGTGDFVSYLKHRVEQARAEHQAACDRFVQLIAERDMLQAELQGYEKALAAELRRQGITGTSNILAAQETLPLSAGAAMEETVNKAEFARRFIRGRADTGATPGDIYKGFQDAGIPVGKPYIYALVQRIQKQGWIRPRRGKWYPVPELEQPHSNGTGAETNLP